MKKIALAVASLWLALVSPALAANVNIDGLGTPSPVAGTDLYECEQGGVNNKCTPAQLSVYLNSLISGDCTVSANVITCAGPTHLSGTAPSLTAGNVTTNANLTGVVTSSGNTTSYPAAAALTILTNSTNASAAPTFVGASITNCVWLRFGTTISCQQLGAANSFGNANSLFMNATGSAASFTSVTLPACANDGAHAITYTNGTGFVCTAVTGSGISSVTAGIGLTAGTVSGAVTVSAPATARNTTTTTDTITSTDKGTIVTESNASSVAVAITTAGFASTDYFTVKNLGVGTATYTPSSGTIDGAATLVCTTNQSADLYFDGTNYKSLSKNCGLTSTIASGTAVLGTSAIASGACATVVTVTATNVATTDVVHFGYNGDPTAVTGYGVSATGAVLSIYPYPSSGNVNVKVCNSTAGSITPSAMTLNWQVTR